MSLETAHATSASRKSRRIASSGASSVSYRPAASTTAPARASSERPVSKPAFTPTLHRMITFHAKKNPGAMTWSQCGRYFLCNSQMDLSEHIKPFFARKYCKKLFFFATPRPSIALTYLLSLHRWQFPIAASSTEQLSILPPDDWKVRLDPSDTGFVSSMY